MSDNKNNTPEKQENQFLKSFTDKKIQELQEGFEATNYLNDLQQMEIPTVCDDGETAITEDLFVEVPYDDTKAERIGYSNYSYWGSTLRVFLKNKVSVAILIFLVAILAFTFIQPYLPNQFDPYVVNNDANGETLRNVQPNSTFWFGTNDIGQDMWSRIWQGTRTSLIIGICAATTSMVLGMCMGCAWGYARKFDWLFTEIYNLFDNIPYTILRMLLIYILRPSIPTMILVMCLTGWLPMSKYIRNMILIYRDREFNLASRCLGTSSFKIITKNILPQLVSVIMLQTALAIPGAIGSEVFLTYVGLGLPIQIPSLGNLVDEGRKVMLVEAQRYQLMFPMMMTSAITVSFYALGNAFADAADPRNHR
jgi:oligopeptide transport system permease protein